MSQNDIIKAANTLKGRSVLALRDLLDAAHVHPDKTPSELLVHLRSQGSLAKYENHKIGIIKMALNTQKEYCDILLPGGYVTLNKLREKIFAKLDGTNSSKPKPSRGSRANLQGGINYLKKINQKLVNEIAEASDKYYDLSTIAQGFAIEATFKNALKRHRERYDKNPAKLTIIKGGKN